MKYVKCEPGIVHAREIASLKDSDAKMGLMYWWKLIEASVPEENQSRERDEKWV